MSDTRVHSLLRQQDWGRIGSVLLAYTISRAGMYSWRSGGPHELVGHTTAQDVVSEVITKTLDGRRCWDPQRGQLVPWLKQQIDSELDHLARSASHRHERSMVTEVGGQDGAADDGLRQTDYADSEVLEPENLLLRQEQLSLDFGTLAKAVGDDAGLNEMVMAMLDGCPPDAETLAQRLGVPVGEIYTRRRRLHRRLSRLERTST